MAQTKLDEHDNPFTRGAFAKDDNPFRTPRARAAVEAVPDDAAPGTYSYRMVQSGPAVHSDDVELTGVPSVEVMIFWGTQVLHVDHLTPPRDYWVGEEENKRLRTDVLVPTEKLGVSRMPVVVMDAGRPCVVIPKGATGKVELAIRGEISLDEARAESEPCAALGGAHQFPLPADGRARVEIGDFSFQIAAVAAGKPVAHGLGAGMDWTVSAYFGASLLAHAGLVAAMALFVPPIGMNDDEGVQKDQLYLLQQYLDAAAEREEEAREDQLTDQSTPSEEGGTGEQAAGEEGAMGKLDAPKTNNTYGVKGPKDNPDPHISRQELLREAADFGMVGMLNAALAGDPDAQIAPWGRDTALGMDDTSALGAMFGDAIGENVGGGGLGLTGLGSGGGFVGEGIGLGTIGTIGHGAGLGTRDGFGNGKGGIGGSHGRLARGHQHKTPRMRIGDTVASGRLPKEVIQRVVRNNYGRFRLCYERGLMQNPNLEGRVTVRFVIDRTGAVSNVSNGGSDLPSNEVVRCVIRNYYGLSFPAPDNGIVTVSYPIMFSPG